MAAADSAAGGTVGRIRTRGARHKNYYYYSQVYYCDSQVEERHRTQVEAERPAPEGMAGERPRVDPAEEGHHREQRKAAGRQQHLQGLAGGHPPVHQEAVRAGPMAVRPGGQPGPVGEQPPARQGPAVAQPQGQLEEGELALGRGAVEAEEGHQQGPAVAQPQEQLGEREPALGRGAVEAEEGHQQGPPGPPS